MEYETLPNFLKKKHFIRKLIKTSSSWPICRRVATHNHVHSLCAWELVNCVCSVFCILGLGSLPSAVLTLSLWALKTLSISAGAIVPSKPTGIPFVFPYGTTGVVGVGGADDANGDCNCLISSFIRRSSAPVWSGKDRLIRFELHFLRLARKFTSFLMFISNPLSVPLRSSRSEVDEVPLPWVVLGLWFSYLLRVGMRNVGKSHKLIWNWKSYLDCWGESRSVCIVSASFGATDDPLLAGR